MDKTKEPVLASPQICTGCGACRSACPENAITMVDDRLGFLVPLIDHSSCVLCGECMRACPAIHPVPMHENTAACYAAQGCDEIRLKSSSGGIFVLLAREVLGQGGIVFGAAMEHNLVVRHVCVRDVSKLERLLGSKYVQSDCTGCFEQAKSLLEAGRTVLYSGCPCQIAGLRNFLGKEYDSLITVDLLCHGVPSPKMFREAITTAFPEGNVQSVSFRDKTHGQGWISNAMTIQTNDGGTHGLSAENCAYEAAYHKSISLRECCYSCPYAVRQRVADVTLGDFWGIENHNPSLNDNLGTSLVLTNSEKGAELFSRVAPELSCCEQVAPEISLNNRLHGIHLNIPAARARFLDMYPRLGFQRAAELAAFDKYDVGLIGCWSVENHGSNLTYYALYQTLRDIGLEPLLIERPANALWPPNQTASGFADSPYKPWDMAPIFPNRNTMKELNDQCGVFVLGSDQLLYHDLYSSFGEFADLSYINSNKRKIAYATSVGRSYFEGSEDQRARISLFFQDFDSVSVREQDGVSLFADTFGVKSDWVLDPVFLCNLSYYEAMASRGKKPSNHSYIAVYMLDPTEKKESMLKSISSALNKPCCVFSDVAQSQEAVASMWSLTTDTTACNEDWLRALKDSDYVITDSFHGTCFAILFQKPFLSIVNDYRGRSRFISLLSQFGLEDRMMDDSENISDFSRFVKEIDYTKVQAILEQEIRRSTNWLKTALSKPFRKPLSYFNLLDDRLIPVEAMLHDTTERSFATESWLANTHKRVNLLEQSCVRTDEMEAFKLNPDRLEKLSTRVIILEKTLDQMNPFFRRVDALEQVYGRVDALEQVYGRVDALELVYGRVDALEQVYGRVDTLEQVYGRVDALEQVYGRVDVLEQVYGRVDALEQVYGRVDALEQVYGRVDALKVDLANAMQQISRLESQTWVDRWKKSMESIKISFRGAIQKKKFK